jgi:hypothetical protein
MAFVGKRQGPGTKGVELYAQVRFAVQIEGVSRREAARRFGTDPRTVAKMLAFSVPPGYRRTATGASRSWIRLPGSSTRSWRRMKVSRASSGIPRSGSSNGFEYGYSGGISIVKDYVQARRLWHREVFVPLRRDPGHAQVDFGEALAEIAGSSARFIFRRR